MLHRAPAPYSQLLPDASLIEDSAGALTYAFSSTAAKKAAPLLQYVESLKPAEDEESATGSGVMLTDWLISYTTLEDVFLSLAQAEQGSAPETKATTEPKARGCCGCLKRKPTEPLPNSRTGLDDEPAMSKASKLASSAAHPASLELQSAVSSTKTDVTASAKVPGIASQAAETAMAAGEEPVDAAAVEVAPTTTEPHKRSQHSNAIRATFRKNATLLRRHLFSTIVTVLTPPIILLIALLLNVALNNQIDKSRENAEKTKHVITEACMQVRDSIDRACSLRESLVCGNVYSCNPYETSCVFCYPSRSSWYLEPRSYDEYYKPQCESNEPKYDYLIAQQCDSAGLYQYAPDFTTCPDGPNYPNNTGCETGCITGSSCVCIDPQTGRRSAEVSEMIELTTPCTDYASAVLGVLGDQEPPKWINSNITAIVADLSTTARGSTPNDNARLWNGWQIPVFASGEAQDVLGGVSGPSGDDSLIGGYQSSLWDYPPPEQTSYYSAYVDPALDLPPNGTANEVYSQEAVDMVFPDVSATGLLRYFPYALGHTSFGTKDGQPLSECNVVNTSVRCCMYTYPNGERCGEPGPSPPPCPPPPYPSWDSESGQNVDWVNCEETGNCDEPYTYRYESLGDYVSWNDRWDGGSTECTYSEETSEWESPKCIGKRDELGLDGALKCADVRITYAPSEPVQDWVCSEVQCPEREAYIIPGLSSGGWESIDQLRSSIKESQSAVRTSRPVVVPSRPGVVMTNKAEDVFPSMALDVDKIIPANAELLWSYHSFLSDWNSFPYVVYEDTYPQILGGVRRSSSVGNYLRTYPAVMQNIFTNMLLASEAQADVKSEVLVGYAFFPEPERRKTDDLIVTLRNALEFVLFAIVPLSAALLIATFVGASVQEKQLKLRALTSMMGLTPFDHLLTEWLWNSILSHLTLFVLWLFGIIYQLDYFKRSAGSLFLVFMLWAQLQIGLAMFCTNFFNRVLPALIVLYLLIVASAIGGYAIWEDKKENWPWAIDFYPPFAFFHCLYLCWRKETSAGNLFNPDNEVSLPWLLMFIATLWVPIAALYLDQVIPKQYGVARHPLFFLGPLLRLCTCSGDDDDTKTAVHREDVRASLELEDADVAAERRAVEEGAHDDAPVRLLNLRKVYGRGATEKVAVDDVTFHIETDQAFGLLGTNGAGKSTTISVLTGLTPPTSGSATVAGFDIRTEMNLVQERTGVCPQFDILWPELTVIETLLFYLRLKGIVPVLEKERAVEVAAQVGLYGDDAKKKISELSGGMMRRVSLAISLVGNPVVAFLDEPTTGLDPETRRTVWEFIQQCQKGRVVVLTTHSMEEADALCTHIGIMAGGGLRAIGTSTHLKNSIGNEYTVDIAFTTGEIDKVTAFIASIMPDARLVSTFAHSCTYKVQRSAVSLGEVWKAMEERPEDVGILDWGVRQTSLEEVFVKIASQYP